MNDCVGLISMDSATCQPNALSKDDLTPASIHIMSAVGSCHVPHAKIRRSLPASLSRIIICTDVLRFPYGVSFTRSTTSSKHSKQSTTTEYLDDGLIHVIEYH